MSVDVEGCELEILQSNNWEAIRPKVVLVEFLESTLTDIVNSAITNLLEEEGYIVFAKSFNTVFYMTSDFFRERMAI